MKKIMSIAVATLVLASSTFAIELDTESMYAGAGLGIESIGDYDSGVTLVLMGGIPFLKNDDLGPGTLAIETELTYSIVDSSIEYSQFNFFGQGNYTQDVSLFSLAVYSAYTYDINEQFFVKPRIGLIYRSADYSASSFGGIGSYSDIGLALGVQGGYTINDQLDVTIGLNLIDGTDITHLTAGVQYHF